MNMIYSWKKMIYHKQWKQVDKNNSIATFFIYTYMHCALWDSLGGDGMLIGSLTRNDWQKQIDKRQHMVLSHTYACMLWYKVHIKLKIRSRHKIL